MIDPIIKRLNDLCAKHGCLPGEDRFAWLDERLNAKLFHVKPHDLGRSYIIEHDGFSGMVIGGYTTNEGKEGVVLQQHGTKVVHVYGRKWLKDAG